MFFDKNNNGAFQVIRFRGVGIKRIRKMPAYFCTQYYCSVCYVEFLFSYEFVLWRLGVPIFSHASLGKSLEEFVCLLLGRLMFSI